MTISKHIFSSAAILFWLLFIFPEVPIALFNANAISFSLALPFFAIWFALNLPRIWLVFHMAYTKYPICLLFCAFSLWGFFRSLLTFSTLSISYGLYHSIFVIMSFAIFVTFFERSKNNAKLLRIVDNNIIIVGLVLATGTIWSVYYGPIYPSLNSNVEFTTREWSGISINSGVGFSSSANVTSTYILFFLLYVFFIPTSRLRYLYSAFLAYALTATLSRTGLGALLFSLGAIVLLHLFKTLRTAQIPGWLASSIKIVATAFICAVGYLAANPNFKLRNQAFTGVSSNQLTADFNERVNIWGFFIRKYLDDDFFTVVAGRGWRQTSAHGEWGTAWFTAHNSMLTIFGEFGIVGITLIIFFFGFSFYTLGKSILKKSLKDSHASQFCFAFLVAILTESIAEEHLLSPILGILLMYAFCRFYAAPYLPSTKDQRQSSGQSFFQSSMDSDKLNAKG